MIIDTKKLENILNKVNAAYKELAGIEFCRCYNCAFPVLIKHIRQFPDDAKGGGLGNILEEINTDYLHSADYRDYIGKTGLECGHGCNSYEDVLEAVPFLFWEINKEHLEILEDLLSDKEFQSCFQ